MASVWSTIPGRSLVRAQPAPGWASLLEAAMLTPYYSAEPRRALLEKAARMEPGAGLALLETVELNDYFEQFREFCNPAVSKPVPRPIGLGWRMRRTTAVQPWFHMDAGTDLLVSGVPEGLARTRPECLAGPVDPLRSLAGEALAGRLRLEELILVVVFTGIGFPLLTADDRELFWQAFQVPVIEQFRGLQGELLACECESHEGLHIQTGSAIFESRGGVSPELLATSLANLRHPVLRLATGLTAAIEAAACGCGQGSPRLCNLARLPQGAPERAAAAVA